MNKNSEILRRRSNNAALVKRNLQQRASRFSTDIFYDVHESFHSSLTMSG